MYINIHRDTLTCTYTHTHAHTPLTRQADGLWSRGAAPIVKVPEGQSWSESGHPVWRGALVGTGGPMSHAAAVYAAPLSHLGGEEAEEGEEEEEREKEGRKRRRGRRRRGREEEGDGDS